MIRRDQNSFHTLSSPLARGSAGRVDGAGAARLGRGRDFVASLTGLISDFDASTLATCGVDGIAAS
jgi:hypothetical protein